MAQKDQTNITLDDIYKAATRVHRESDAKTVKVVLTVEEDDSDQ